MFHDVRNIPLTEMPNLSENIKLWNGSSRGYWDGDTLVIDTQNFSEKSAPGLNTEAKILQERITRISDTELQYDLIAHDPGTYSADYTRRIIFEYSADKIYEYACHEGNYGMMNILSGHRAEEARALAGQ
jgi:inosine/xanthosine triphosphate pyrophosphatase family protein